ncbi:MAG: hypothetical protein EXR73_06455 [Myxococcales bacterium]|nr:hypothetical protein [Myxococcales bacterium]
MHSGFAGIPVHAKIVSHACMHTVGMESTPPASGTTTGASGTTTGASGTTTGASGTTTGASGTTTGASIPASVSEVSSPPQATTAITNKQAKGMRMRAPYPKAYTRSIRQPHGRPYRPSPTACPA